MEDFRSWQWLECVIELGGLKPASERLHRTPSTISHAIKQLERRIGVTLVETRARRIQLTEAGQILLEHMRPLIRELEGVQGVIDQFRGDATSVVSLAVDQVFRHDLLIQAMESFSRDYPHTRLELFETVLVGGPSLFMEGRVGIYLGLEPVGDHTGAQIGRMRFVPCSGVGHPLAEMAAELDADDVLYEAQLRQYRQIVLRDSHPERGKNAGWLGAAQRVTVDHLHTAVELMRSGMGFAWLPEDQAKDETGLVVLPVDDALCPEAGLVLYRQRELQASPAYSRLVQALMETARD